MLIGLCGMPNSGKSEVKRILVERYGFFELDTKQILREMAAKLTGLDAREFVSQHDKQKAYNGVSRRKIMGELGNVAEKLWGDFFMIERALDAPWVYPGKRIVIDALRKTQTRNLQSRGGYVFQVCSDRAIDTGNDFDWYDNAPVCYSIENNGSFSELEDAISRAAELWGF